MKRRQFLQKVGIGSGALLIPQTIIPFDPFRSGSIKSELHFGIVADPHHGMLPDVNQRMEKFISKAIEKDVDFIIQLGDFCHPGEKSKSFLDIWEEYKKPKYHVLGNHDMDLASKEEIMDIWGMASPYYSFDEGGIKFIVLDANYLYMDGKFIDYEHSNFYVDSSMRTFINDEQIEWFASELEMAQSPVIVLSHQSLWHYQSGVKNRLALQKLMEKYTDKIICCFNGHNHIDFHHYQNGINYFDINSMSYQWFGEKYKVSRYPKEMLKEYRWLEHIAPYQDPLFAFAKLDYGGKLSIKGVRSEWSPPSPEEAGIPKQVYGNEYSPEISDYEIEF